MNSELYPLFFRPSISDKLIFDVPLNICSHRPKNSAPEVYRSGDQLTSSCAREYCDPFGHASKQKLQDFFFTTPVKWTMYFTGQAESRRMGNAEIN